MTNLNLENDFLVFDQKETLTWHRPRSYGSVSIAGALRLTDLQKVASDDTFVEQEKIVWLFPQSALPEETPIPGDLLKDSQNVRWTICEVEELKRRGCWKCTAICMMRHFDLRDLLDIYRPLWTLDENGAPFPEYRLSRPGIPGKIMPTGTDSRGKPMETEIHFAEPELHFQYRDCLVTASNRAFRVLEVHPASSWQEVTRVICKEVTL